MKRISKEKVISFLEILLGNLLLAMAVKWFILPYHILSGGMAGIATIISRLTSISDVLIIDILDIGFFLLGWWILGRKFALTTAISAIVYPIFLHVLSLWPVSIDCGSLMAAIFGGAIAGVGVGIVFRNDGSTGGTDVIVLIAHKYTGMEISKLTLITDSIVAAAGLYLYGIEALLTGLLAIYISSQAIYKVMMPSSSSAVALYIISDKMTEIGDYIHSELYRGTTIMKAEGGYTNEKRNVILTVVAKNQYAKLTSFIQNIDPYAFIIVSDAKEVRGEGFTYEYRV